MKLPRLLTSLGALVIVSGALAAAPSARANDFVVPFGAKMTAPVNGLFVATTAAHWATTISAHALVTALAMHEDHHDLGGNIACNPGSWTLHEQEGEGGWRHHDDDGDDDGHVNKAAIPEPSTGLLLFSGVSALAGWRLRHRIQRNTPADIT